jgi:hypothetical protein
MALTQKRENLLWLHSELDDLGLDPFAFRIYAHLARRAESTGRAWPKIEDIATHCGISERMVRSCIQKLVDERLIVIVGGAGAKGGGRRNVYHLVARNEWLASKLKAPEPDQPAQDAACSGDQPAQDAGCNRHDMPVDYKEKGNPDKGNPTGGASAATSHSKASEGKVSGEEKTPEVGTGKKARGKSPDPRKFLADFPPEWRENDEFCEAWIRWGEARIAARKAMTPQAATLARNKLTRFPVGVGVQALDRATLQGWTGVFPESIVRPDGKGSKFDAASGNASDQDFGF